MCASCEQWMVEQTLGYMKHTGVHLEVALRLTRDAFMQNALHDETNAVGVVRSPEVKIQEMVNLCEYHDAVAEWLRSINPVVLAAAVEFIDSLKLSDPPTRKIT